MSVDVVIIAAMEREVGPLVRGWRRTQLKTAQADFSAFERDGVLVVCCGIGGARARAAAVAVMTSEHPAMLVSAGFAGALQARLTAGEILCPATVVDLSTGARFDGGGRDGVLVSASSILDADGKRRIAGSFSAEAVDMEAAAVALVANQFGCRFFALKAVSDEAGVSLPDFERLVDDDGRIRTAKIVAACVVRPGSWPLLLRLARNTARASRELCRALARFIEEKRVAPQPEFSGRAL